MSNSDFKRVQKEVLLRDPEHRKIYFYFRGLDNDISAGADVVKHFQQRWQAIADHNFDANELAIILLGTCLALKNPRNFSCTSNICEFLGETDNFAIWSDKAIEKINQFSAENLATGLWVAGHFARRGIAIDHGFVQTSMRVAQPRLGEFNPENFAKCLWAAGQFAEYNVGDIEKIKAFARSTHACAEDLILQNQNQKLAAAFWKQVVDAYIRLAPVPPYSSLHRLICLNAPHQIVKSLGNGSA